MRHIDVYGVQPRHRAVCVEHGRPGAAESLRVERDNPYGDPGALALFKHEGELLSCDLPIGDKCRQSGFMNDCFIRGRRFPLEHLSPSHTERDQRVQLAC